MKFFHLADLHLGKRLAEYSLIEDQNFILKQIISFIDSEKPDCILVSGDVFDKSIPSEDAITLWDNFLFEVNLRKVKLFAISGNHDSAIRFSEHRRLINNNGIYLAQPYNGRMEHCSIEDFFGKINIYMLPYVRIQNIRNFFQDKEIDTYTDGVETVIEREDIHAEERNIILSHQFVTGGERRESEEQVGSLDGIESFVFDAFDYVALGHLHKAQHISRKEIRYSGSPLKYSLSEKDDVKSFTIVELKEKGNIDIKITTLKPLRDVREIRGTFEEISSGNIFDNNCSDDYFYVVLTDELEYPNAFARLKSVYRNLVGFRYDNSRTRKDHISDEFFDMEKAEPMDIFKLFYEKQNNRVLTKSQEEILNKAVTEVLEEIE